MIVDGTNMITVCMTIYNGEKFIKKQLESIFNQTCKPDEVTICDDNSSDKTVHIINRFIADNHLGDRWKLYINDVNKGYPGNAYYCMGLAQGDIVFLSDQDDLWSPEKIEIPCFVMREFV